jgi:molybdopterin-binding protein
MPKLYSPREAAQVLGVSYASLKQWIYKGKLKSGRNQLTGRITDIKVNGLLAQVTLSVGGQRITSIITADAVRELRLKSGQVAVALIKSTEVMIVLPD